MCRFAVSRRRYAKEHHFMQTWCRGKKQFESELLCTDCHMFSWRSYSDPDFMLPEEYDKVRLHNFNPVHP